MSDTVPRAMREKSGGDTAVDGLLSGILSGVGMSAYLVLIGVIGGVPPAVMLGRFDPEMDGRWLIGTAAHLAVSGVYGVVFALLFAVMVRWLPALLRFGWLIGLVYGLVLATLARGVLLPIAGSSLLQVAAVQLVIAHAIYGLILGTVLGRKW